MAQKQWAVGEEVLSADFNTYVQNQVVPQFATTTQRDSQWTAPPNGAMCVTTDTYTIWQRAAGAWRPMPALPANRQIMNLNGAPISATETWLGTLTVPSLPYAHRIRYVATQLFNGGASAFTVDMHVRYNTTGAAIALTDPLHRSVRTYLQISGQHSLVATGSIDRASGPTSVGVLALTSGPTSTLSVDATLNQFEIWAEAT